MIRDANATKARILEAATVEFADHGLAGARVDRLAALAGANKERIYANFGSKEALFDATVVANIQELLDTVPMDADDLPGYAERLFDFTIDHPHLLRLALWHSLERPGRLEELPESADSMAQKVSALRDAQRRGIVDDSVPAELLTTLILGIVHAGLILAPTPDNHAELAGLRAATRLAVSRLTAPRAP
jgi:AcrR family transcriptional regulator